MRKRLALGFSLLLTISLTVIANPPAGNPFVFDPAKMDPGNVYLYHLSGNPEEFELRSLVYYYYKAFSGPYLDIEEASVRINQEKSEYRCTYRINLDRMMLERSTFQYLPDKNSLSPNMTYQGETTVDFAKKRMKFDYLNRTEKGFQRYYKTVEYKITPTFSYSFEHVDGWTVMRFYPYPEKRIQVGEINSSLFYVDADVEYLGQETVEVPYGKVDCHKFEITGRGLLARLYGKKAWIWMSAEDERNYMVKYRNDNPRSTFLPVVEMRLADIKKMTPEEWAGLFVTAEEAGQD
ncbi:MAG: DUF3108 domain-containing protein [Clostridia bacterium]|nr:DUF3108 domain-containing protein [Clostridia bacterium]